MGTEWNRLITDPADVRAITMAGTEFRRPMDEYLSPVPLSGDPHADATRKAREKIEQDAANAIKKAKEERARMMEMGLLPADAEHAMQAKRTRVGRLLAELEQTKVAGNDPVENIVELVSMASTAIHGISLGDIANESMKVVGSDEKDEASAPTERNIQQTMNRITPLPQ